VIYSAAVSLGLIFSSIAANAWVKRQAEPLIHQARDVSHAQTAIVLGAFVSPRGELCPMLEDRVETAIQLFKAGKVDSLLMTGDHGKVDYDEANAMKRYAVKKGVPADKIFTDHAGFNTYDSMVRARQVFGVETAVVVTNGFHLERAVFLARTQGIKAEGVVADLRPYTYYYGHREFLARCKAVLNTYLLRPEPKFLGPAIPITGDAHASDG
jgi:SanA protein